MCSQSVVAMDADKRRKITQSLLAETSSSKSSIARILMRLYEQGALIDGAIREPNARAIRHDLTTAAREMGRIRTPFGPIVQTMPLNTTPPIQWSFLNPMALLFYLSKQSESFQGLMNGLIDKHQQLSIIIYIDEFRPGNVLRPDQGRATQHLLWTFTEFPEWLTVRDCGWFTFGVIRSSEIKTLPGKVSCLMKHVLHNFVDFGQTGGMIATSPPRLFKAGIAGILGDEKGLKEVWGTKGPGGTRPCLHCKNVCQFLDDEIAGHAYLVSISCSQRSRFDLCSDAEVYIMVDELCAIAARGVQAALEQAEQKFGINFVPEGLLFDRSLRQVVRPISGWLRDWMHMMLVQGCANIEVEQMIHTIRNVGVTLEQVQHYVSQFNLPKAHQVTMTDWFTSKRVGRPSDEKDGWRGFAGELMTLVHIFLDFLELAVVPLNVLDVRHFQSFRLMDKLLKFFALGTESVVKHLIQIEQTNDSHAVLFAALYPQVIKPKFHHLFHVIDHMKQINRLCSCFVTERRHRLAKTPAANIFNNYEKTLTTTQLCLMADRMGKTVFEPAFLEHPQHLPVDIVAAIQTAMPGIAGLAVSTSAHLLCGVVKKGDVVMIADQRVGEVQQFFSFSFEGKCQVFAVLRERDRTQGSLRYSAANGQTVVLQSHSIVAPLIYGTDVGSIRIVLPAASVTW